MQIPISSARARTIAGVAIFAGLGLFLLALMACLKVPVGNPEKSRIDPALSGVWRVENMVESGAAVWIIEPWDARTWMLTTLSVKEEESADDAAATTPGDVLTQLESRGLESVDSYKAWLATFSGVRFIVLEPKKALRDLAGERPEFWFVFRVKKPTADRVELFLVEGEQILNAETTSEAERILRKQARDPALYGNESDPVILSRVPVSEYSRVEELLESLNISTQ